MNDTLAGASPVDQPVRQLVELLRVGSFNHEIDALMHEAAAEIERLQADSVLLAWVLAHPETCAEVLEDAALDGGDPRALIEARRDGLPRHNVEITGAGTASGSL